MFLINVNSDSENFRAFCLSSKGFFCVAVADNINYKNTQALRRDTGRHNTKLQMSKRKVSGALGGVKHISKCGRPW